MTRGRSNDAGSVYVRPGSMLGRFCEPNPTRAGSVTRSSRIRRVVVVALVLSVRIPLARAQLTSCDNKSAERAERALERPHETWTDVYKSYAKFRRCDEGVVGEAFSDIVVRLLADRWDRLPELRRLVAMDGHFRTFILDHIDATTDYEQLSEVMRNARSHCMEGDKSLCTQIADRAFAARRQIKRLMMSPARPDPSS